MTTPTRLVRPGGHAPERDPDTFEHDNPLPDVWEGRLRQEEQFAPPPLRTGLLRREIDAACADGGFNLADLTVLSDKLDPYRRDTNAGHRDGQWFAAQVARFVPGNAAIHLRGGHYKISSAGDVLKPNGAPYLNNHDDWVWLMEVASKAARWLGYVPFTRIVDERNDRPHLFARFDYSHTGFGTLVIGSAITAPAWDSALPEPICKPPQPAPPYRIVLIGEKSSLYPELDPVAREVHGELILPTGEISDTLIYELAARAAADGRPTVVLYFSDFDPAGWEMPANVGRKLQALKTLYFPDLDIQVHKIALTLEQAVEFDLPSTPLSPGEKRADNWRARWAREQTELDALIALHPGAVQEIARAAVAPFFDATLAERCAQIADEWETDAQSVLNDDSGYDVACVIARAAHIRIAKAVADYHATIARARARLPALDAEVLAPEADIAMADQPDPLFHTDDDFIEASRRLKAFKKLRE